MAPAADYLILKRRAQEESRMQYEQITKNEKHARIKSNLNHASKTNLIEEESKAN